MAVISVGEGRPRVNRGEREREGENAGERRQRKGFLKRKPPARFSLLSPESLSLSSRAAILSASLQVAGTRPSGHLRPRDRSHSNRLLPLFLSRLVSRQVMAGIARSCP